MIRAQTSTAGRTKIFIGVYDCGCNSYEIILGPHPDFKTQRIYLLPSDVLVGKDYILAETDERVDILPRGVIVGDVLRLQ